MFTEQDLTQIAAQGISREKIDRQITHFIQGFPYLDAIRAATIGDGIVRIDEQQSTGYTRRFDDVAGDYSLMKFVPASGAATRMFKSLFADRKSVV